MRLNRLIKSTLVLTSFLSFFVAYCYIRLIRPYFDVEVKNQPVKASILHREIYYIDGNRYSYWTNGTQNPRKILVMLPPSVATGDYFGRYAQNLPPDVLMIAPDYPGRGLSTSIEEFDTAQLLASRVGALLKTLVGESPFTIVAPSFGGMIATNLTNIPGLNIEKIILIATGEFFATDQKYLYHFIFYPATVSERARIAYARLLTDRHQFENIKYSNLKDLLEQWMMTLEYKIDTKTEIAIPVVLVKFDYDNIVQLVSYDKYKIKFPNLTIYNLPLEHINRSFFDEAVFNLINSNL